MGSVRALSASRSRALAAWEDLSSTPRRKYLALFFLALIVAGIAWRIGASISHGNFTGNDQRFYSTLAKSLADGLGYAIPRSRDEFHWAPGAPAGFAIFYKIFGEGGSGYRGMYIAQLVFSLAALWALYWFAQRFTKDRLVALGATAVLAISTGAVRTETDLITEPLGSLLLLLAAGTLGFALIDARGREHSFRWALVSGGLLALAILTRPDFLVQPLVWVLVVVFVWRESWRKRLNVAAALVAAVLVVMTPYCVWASNKADQLVMPTTSGATTYWVGTYLPGHGTTIGARRHLREEIYRNFPGSRAAEDAPGADLMVRTLKRRHPDIKDGDAAIRLELRRNIRKYALGQPFAFATMMAEKPWLMWRMAYKGHAHERSWWATSLHVPTLIGAVIAVLGLLWLRRRNLVVALVGWTLVIGTLVAILGPAIPRANARYAPLALLGAAVVVAALIEWWRKGRTNT